MHIGPVPVLLCPGVAIGFCVSFLQIAIYSIRAYRNAIPFLVNGALVQQSKACFGMHFMTARNELKLPAEPCGPLTDHA